jgi:hypothetical protein
MAYAHCLSIPKATNTSLEYVTFIAFPLQQWLHERIAVLLSCYTPSLPAAARTCERCYERYVTGGHSTIIHGILYQYYKRSGWRGNAGNIDYFLQQR